MRWLFRLHRKQALQSKFSAGIFTKRLTFPSGFGILFRQGLIDRCKSGCSAAGSVLDWGSRGRRFKSCHSDQIKPFFREKGRLFCNLFWVFKISQTAFGVCLGFILQKTRAFPLDGSALLSSVHACFFFRVSTLCSASAAAASADLMLCE